MYLENGTGTSVYTTNIFQQVKKQYNDGISVDFSSLRAQSPPCIDPMLTVLYHNNPSETSPSEDCATPEDW
ncbi:hypothetical protein QFC22_005646 [Naganishia vaughanmartiniae]|uniref:Uncharacterized protein n=1 Tax=Naganishia vaughanmartiniae TaxID=1424756 RepID=A0ACC2WTY9_9TREE|nr:hypothetical protein QFC22_005646 [Naganishia vaughanmartiniae]